jgi:HD-GYP domain-containing protein (c-di-GMP phosphodiesterase class II)
VSTDETGKVERPGMKSPDERLREQGLVIITRLLATVRTGRAYKVGNQVFTRQLESFIESVLQAVDETGEAVFVDLDGDLYLNGARLPVKPNSLRFHEAVRKEFQTRKIAGFRATKGLSIKEVEVFFELFMQHEPLHGTALLHGCSARGDRHLLPIIHASAQAPGEGDGQDGEAGVGPNAGAGADASKDGAAAGAGDGAAGLIGEESSSGWNLDRGANKKAFLMALQGMRTLLHTPEQGVELRHAKRVVQPLVDGAFSSEPVVVGLSGLNQRDDYTYAHAVNVCLVAVNIGQVMGLDRRQLADLGVAVLLHDVGKGAVASQITHDLEEFTAEERAAAERHPVDGAKLITRSSVLNQTTLRCIRVALEHHMGPGGTGYPHTDPPWGPSLLSRITSVADCYVNLLTHRSERGKGMTPYKALSIMFGPLQDRFDLGVLWALVQVVGFYPPGQMVRLDDDSVALVLANNREDPSRPHVKLVLHPNGRGVKAHENIEFRPLPADRSIKRALRAKEYPDVLGAPSEEQAA